VVELDPQRSAVSDGDREVEALVLHAQLVEVAQRLAREVADLRVVALGLELGDHDHGEHDVVLGEPEHGLGIGEQDRGVEHVGALGLEHPSRLGLRRLRAGELSHVHSIPGRMNPPDPVCEDGPVF
jgi:hypothetical protein